MEARIAKLERQCWWYRNLFALLLVAIVAGVGLGVKHQGAAPKVITARAFQVVDDSGRVRGGLDAFAGKGRIALFNSKGKITLFAVAGNSGGMLRLNNNGGKATVTLMGADDSETGGVIALSNKTGETVVQLKADEEGNGNVVMWR